MGSISYYILRAIVTNDRVRIRPDFCTTFVTFVSLRSLGSSDWHGKSFRPCLITSKYDDAKQQAGKLLCMQQKSTFTMSVATNTHCTAWHTCSAHFHASRSISDDVDPTSRHPAGYVHNRSVQFALFEQQQNVESSSTDDVSDKVGSTG